MLDKIISKNIINANINSSICDVSKLMKKHNIGFVPIKRNNKYVGVITDRDIALILPTLKSIDDKVEPYISNNVISIDIESSIGDALNLMKNKKIKRLLVKEKDNTIGVLSLSDILNYTNNNNIVETYRIIFSISDNNKELLSDVYDFKL